MYPVNKPTPGCPVSAVNCLATLVSIVPTILQSPASVHVIGQWCGCATISQDQWWWKTAEGFIMLQPFRISELAIYAEQTKTWHLTKGFLLIFPKTMMLLGAASSEQCCKWSVGNNKWTAVHLHYPIARKESKKEEEMTCLVGGAIIVLSLGQGITGCWHRYYFNWM